MNANFEDKIEVIMRKLPTEYRAGRFLEVEQDLLALLSFAATPDERFLAQGTLGSHYAFQRNWKKTEEALLARIRIDDTRVEGWLGLAEHFHYYNEDLELAFMYIEKALVAALAAGELVRQVLGVKIRISLALNNYPAVELCLQMLIDYKCPKGGFDIAFESDFISRIPAGAIDREILSRYEAVVASNLNSTPT